jgi:hypothetical protein
MTDINMLLESDKEKVIISSDKNDSLATSKERLVLRGSRRTVYPTMLQTVLEFDWIREYRIEVFSSKLRM